MKKRAGSLLLTFVMLLTLLVLPAQAVSQTEISLKGEFIRLVTEKVKDEDLRERIIACGLAALLGGDL